MLGFPKAKIFADVVVTVFVVAFAGFEANAPNAGGGAVVVVDETTPKEGGAFVVLPNAGGGLL